MPDPIPVAHCEYVAGEAGLVTFTVTGVPGEEVSWRFGDATDEAASSEGVTEHTYGAGELYEAIGHVHSTGQRLVMTVGVPDVDPPDPPDPPVAVPNLTSITPPSGPSGTVITIAGTNLATVPSLGFKGSGVGTSFAYPDSATDTEIVTTVPAVNDGPGVYDVTAADPVMFEPWGNSLPFTVT